MKKQPASTPAAIPPKASKKLSDFKAPLTLEDQKELTLIVQKLQRTLSTLRKEYDDFALIASDAYDPYTRKLKFTTKPTFIITDEDLPLSLRKIPQVAPKRWGFIANPEYLTAKQQVRSVLVPYLKKNEAIFLSPVIQRLEVVQHQINHIYKLLETR